VAIPGAHCIRTFAAGETPVIGWHRYDYAPELALIDSIERDLASDIFRRDTARLVLIAHTPPFGTCCDMVGHGGRLIGHAGSIALTEYIKAAQPLLTLHGALVPDCVIECGDLLERFPGHIHETVALAGTFKQQVLVLGCAGV
jgi:hypothetical protein